MTTLSLQQLFESAQAIDQTAIGRALSILVSLAEKGLSIESARGEVSPVDDRLLTPKEAARYLGISWPTLRDSWVERFDIKMLGDGRGQRFRVSELQRVIKLREAESAK